MAEFTLYAEMLWFSPYVFSSFVALREKGVPFDVVEVGLFDGGHLAPAYRDSSITARVPALGHAHSVEETVSPRFVDHARPREIPESYWEFSGTPRLPPA